MKTLYARLGDVKLGETLEDGVNIGVIGKALNKVGVEILDVNGELRDMGDVIEDLMGKWSGLTTAEKQGTAVTLAGKYQYNNLMALLENSEMYYEQLEAARDSLGTVDEQNQIYLDSITGKMNQLQASFEGWIGKLFNPDDMKPFIDQLTNLLTLVGNYTGAVGGFSSLAPLAAGTLLRAGSGAIANNYVNWQTGRARTQQQELNQAAASAMLQGMGVTDRAGLVEGSVTLGYLRGMERFKGSFNEQDAAAYTANARAMMAADNEYAATTAARDKWIKESNIALQLSGNKFDNIIAGKNGTLFNANALLGIENELKSGASLSEGQSRALFNLQTQSAKIAGNLRDSGTVDQGAVNNLIKNLEKLGGTGVAGTQAFSDMQKVIEKLKDTDGVKLTTDQVKALTEQTENATRGVVELRDVIDQVDNGTLNIDPNTGKQLATAADDAENLTIEQQRVSISQQMSMARRQEVEQYVALAGAIGQMAFAWQAFQSLGSLWADDELTTGEKVLNTIMVLGTTIPTLVSAFTGVQAAMKALKEAREQQRNLQLQSIELNNLEAASERNLANAKTNTAKAIKTGKKTKATADAADGVTDVASGALAAKMGKEGVEQVAKKGVLGKIVGTAAKLAVKVVSGPVGWALTAGSIVSGIASIAKGVAQEKVNNERQEIEDKYSSASSSLQETSDSYANYQKLKRQYEETGELTDEYIDSLTSLGDAFGIQETEALKAAGAYGELAEKVEAAREQAMQEWADSTVDVIAERKAVATEALGEFTESFKNGRTWADLFGDIVADLHQWWLDLLADPLWGSIFDSIASFGDTISNILDWFNSPNNIINSFTQTIDSLEKWWTENFGDDYKHVDNIEELAGLTPDDINGYQYAKTKDGTRYFYNYTNGQWDKEGLFAETLSGSAFAKGIQELTETFGAKQDGTSFEEDPAYGVGYDQDIVDDIHAKLAESSKQDEQEEVDQYNREVADEAIDLYHTWSETGDAAKQSIADLAKSADLVVEIDEKTRNIAYSASETMQDAAAAYTANKTNGLFSYTMGSSGPVFTLNRDSEGYQRAMQAMADKKAKEYDYIDSFTFDNNGHVVDIKTADAEDVTANKLAEVFSDSEILSSIDGLPEAIAAALLGEGSEADFRKLIKSAANNSDISEGVIYSQINDILLSMGKQALSVQAQPDKYVSGSPSLEEQNLAATGTLMTYAQWLFDMYGEKYNLSLDEILTALKDNKAVSQALTDGTFLDENGTGGYRFLDGLREATSSLFMPLRSDIYELSDLMAASNKTASESFDDSLKILNANNEGYFEQTASYIGNYSEVSSDVKDLVGISRQLISDEVKDLQDTAYNDTYLPTNDAMYAGVNRTYDLSLSTAVKTAANAISLAITNSGFSDVMMTWQDYYDKNHTLSKETMSEKEDSTLDSSKPAVLERSASNQKEDASSRAEQRDAAIDELDNAARQYYGVTPDNEAIRTASSENLRDSMRIENIANTKYVNLSNDSIKALNAVAALGDMDKIDFSSMSDEELQATKATLDSGLGVLDNTKKALEAERQAVLNDNSLSEAQKNALLNRYNGMIAILKEEIASFDGPVSKLEEYINTLVDTAQTAITDAIVSNGGDFSYDKEDIEAAIRALFPNSEETVQSILTAIFGEDGSYFQTTMAAALEAGDTTGYAHLKRQQYENANEDFGARGEYERLTTTMSIFDDEAANKLYSTLDGLEGEELGTVAYVIEKLTDAGYSLDEILKLASKDATLFTGSVEEAGQAFGQLIQDGYLQDIYNQEFLDKYQEPTSLARTAMMNDEDLTSESASAFLPDDLAETLEAASNRSESLANAFSLLGDNTVDATLELRQFAEAINGIGYTENIRQLEELDQQLEEAKAELKEAVAVGVDTKAVDEARRKVDQLEKQFANKTLELDIDFAGDLLDQADLLVETIGDVKDALDSIGDDYTVAPDALDGLINVFPDILDNAQVTADGLIQLDQAVVDSATASAQDKLVAEVGADAQKLQAAADYAGAMSDMYYAQSDIYSQLAESEYLTAQGLAVAKQTLNAQTSEKAQEGFSYIDDAATVLAENESTLSQQTADAEISASQQSTDIQAANMRIMADNSQKLATVLVNNARSAYDAYASIGATSFNSGKIVTASGIQGGTGGSVSVNTPTGSGKTIDQRSVDTSGSENENARAEAAAEAARTKALGDAYNKQQGLLQAAKASLEANLQGVQTPGSRATSGSSGGSGGSGSGSDKELEHLDKEIDRYERVDTLLAAIQADYDRLNKEQDRLIGNGYAENVAKQIDLMKQQIELQKERLEIEKDEAAELGAKLSSQFGITFDDEGFIDNYADVWKSVFDEVNAYADAGDEDSYNARKKDFENLESWVKSYDTLVSQTIKGTEQDIEDLKDAIEDAQIDLFNKQVDAINDLKDLNEKYTQYQGVLSGRKTDDPFRQMMATQTNLDYYDSDYFDMVSSNLADMAAQVDLFNATGSSDIFGENAAALAKASKTVYDQAIDLVVEFESNIESLQDQILSGIDDIGDRIEKRTKQYDRLAKKLDHQQDVTKLLHGDEAYSEINAILERQQAINLALAQEQQKQVDYWKDILSGMKEGTDEYDAVLEKIHEADEALDETTQKLIENSQEYYKNAANDLIKGFEKANLSGGDLDWAQQEWELITRNAEQYLDDVNRTYEIQKLQSRYLDMLDGSLPLDQQKQITEQMNEQLSNLRNQTKLSKYDVEYANAKLDVLQKQIALEEAQRNKSQMKLRRDSQGNYNYVYTADEGAVKDAQSDLLDSEVNLWNLSKDYSNETYSSYLSEFANLKSQLQAIASDATMDAEEKKKRYSELLKSWQEFYAGLESEMANAQGNMASDFVDLMGMLGEEATATMVDLLDKLNTGTFETFGDIDKRFDETAQSLVPTAENMTETCSKLIEDLGDTAEKAAENIIELSNAIVGEEETQRGLFGVNSSLQETDVALTDLTDKIGSFYDSLANDSGALKEAEEKLEHYKNMILDLQQGVSDYTLNIQTLREENTKLTKEASQATEIKDLYAKGVLRNAADEQAYLNGTLSSGSTNGTGSVFDDATIWKAARDIYTYGTYGVGEVRRSNLISTFNEETQKKVQELINLLYAQGRTDELLDPDRFATGGYTGDFGKEGRLAVLDSKELVLNSDDTENILRAVDVVRALTIDDKLSGIANAITSSVNTTQSALQQEVHIDATFPNATNADEIREALSGLVDRAAQYVHRNR